MRLYAHLTLLAFAVLTFLGQALHGAPSDPVVALKKWLATPEDKRPPIMALPLYRASLTKKQSEQMLQMVFDMRAEYLSENRKQEFKAKTITLGGKTMRYEYHTYGGKSKGGRPLYISMHGGGSAAPQVNDQQWSNQIKLYKPRKGIYLAPRAPTNTWNLWHEPHIDRMFDRLIENFIAIEDIDPNKIYVMGYSAGGDGTYQLAPRMADRWAAAAMMAGHPGDAQPFNLRNLPYILQCGGKDTAYDRHKHCAAWGEKLAALASVDRGAFIHKSIVYPKHGHWMNLECKQALPWMAKHTRNPWPKKLHWYQDDITSKRFFWLSNKNPERGQLITAEVRAQTIMLSPGNSGLSSWPSDLVPKQSRSPREITLRLSDKLLDLNKPITVRNNDGDVLYQGIVERNLAAITTSFVERLDPASAATALLTVNLVGN